MSEIKELKSIIKNIQTSFKIRIAEIDSHVILQEKLAHRKTKEFLLRLKCLHKTLEDHKTAYEVNLMSATLLYLKVICDDFSLNKKQLTRETKSFDIFQQRRKIVRDLLLFSHHIYGETKGSV